MENFLPALLIIAGVIYKIYSEYQKEQEKARRRMPQVPPPTPPVPSEQQRTVIEPTMSVPIPAPIKKTERVLPMPEEVKKIQEKRLEKANSDKKIIVKPVVNLEKETEGITSFDLRAAIIQSAILNRPYQ